MQNLILIPCRHFKGVPLHATCHPELSCIPGILCEGPRAPGQEWTLRGLDRSNSQVYKPNALCTWTPAFERHCVMKHEWNEPQQPGWSLLLLLYSSSQLRIVKGFLNFLFGNHYRLTGSHSKSTNRSGFCGPFAQLPSGDHTLQQWPLSKGDRPGYNTVNYYSVLANFFTCTYFCVCIYVILSQE